MAAADLHRRGRWDEAEARYRAVLDRHPDQPDAMHLLGLLDHQRGRHEEAEARIRRAIALAPGRGDFRNNLGVALKAQGRPAEAEAEYREALRLQPGYLDALSNLGVVLYELGRAEEASGPLEAALRLAPDHVAALFALANIHLETGRPDESIALYRRAQGLAPARADILNNLGTALNFLGRPEEGVECFRRAAEIDPADPGPVANLAVGLEILDRCEEARAAYVRVARLRRQEGVWPLRIAAICPAVFPDAGAILRYRTGLEAVLDAFEGGVDLPPDNPLPAGCRPSFNLDHHGLDNRRLKEKFARIQASNFAAYQARDHPERAGGRPRIGFVVTHQHEGGFVRSMGGVIERMDPDRFDIHVFGPPGGLPYLRRAIRQPTATFHALPGTLAGAWARIREQGCRLLYHWQIGSDPLNYFLPFTRPAPVQCTSWGTHLTSGIPGMQYYLSSKLIEPEDPRDHYTESLIELDGLPTYQAAIERPKGAVRRSEFGLPEGVRLYSCLQRLAKIHPDFDPLLGEILRRDPEGLVLLLEDKSAQATARLRARLGATIPDVADRVAFLPRQGGPRYLRLLSLSDVVLDPLHYNSGFSAYDALGLGLPVVTLPGRLHVGRYTSGCYRRMGYDELIAGGEEDYVRKAVELGRSPDHRRHASRRIAEAAGAIIESTQDAMEFVKFFESSEF